MTFDEKRAVLAESLKMLSTHEPFRRFMEAIETLREGAIADACQNDCVSDAGRSIAAWGHVRAYQEIKDLVSEFSSNEVD